MTTLRAIAEDLLERLEWVYSHTCRFTYECPAWYRIRLYDGCATLLVGDHDTEPEALNRDDHAVLFLLVRGTTLVLRQFPDYEDTTYDLNDPTSLDRLAGCLRAQGVPILDWDDGE